MVTSFSTNTQIIMGLQSNFIIMKTDRPFRFTNAIILAACCAIVVKNGILVESRTIPSSRSFRFPTSGEEENVDTGNVVSVTPPVTCNTQIPASPEDIGIGTQPRIALFSRKNSIPESASISSKSGDSGKELIDSSNEDFLSSVVIEGESGLKTREDADLRNVLCPHPGLDGNETSGLSKIGDSPPTVLNKLRYDLREGKCAVVGSQGHCGRNMIFVAEIDSEAYGYCECDFQNRISRREDKQAGLIVRTIPLVYHPDTNACYRLYEQAYCQEGEWLVLSRKEKGPVCEKKKCPSQASSSSAPSAGGSRRRASKLLTPELWTESPVVTSAKDNKISRISSDPAPNNNGTVVWVPLNGTGPCVLLNAESQENCEKGELVLFNVGDIVPKCGIPGREIEGRAALVRNACPPGSYYSIIGRCQPDWDF